MRFLVLLLCLLLAPPAFAQDDLTQAKAKAEALARQQAEEQSKADALKSEAAAASGDLESLQDRLVRASTRERDLADKLSDLQARAQASEARQTVLEGQLGTRRQDLAALLVGLARLSRLPPEIGMLRQGNTEDAINTAILLQSALPAVQAQARQLTASLQELDAVQKTLAEERAQLDAARTSLGQEEAQIEGLIKARQQKLQLTTAQAGQIAARLDKLRSDSATVDELIRKVTTPRAATPDVNNAPVLALRGGFLQPVAGKAIRQFGQPDEVGTKSLGISFAPGVGARIVSPAKGRVMFAGPFKGYGQIVILEHDGDLHSLIAGFGRLDVAVGQKVNQGEPLGLSSSGGAAGNVYFELRYAGEPIDPRVRQH